MTDNYRHKLAREHAECLLLADELAAMARQGDDAVLADAIRRVQEYNINEMEPHLQHEERTLFAPLVQQHREHLPLCIHLGKEHGLLRTLAENIGDSSNARQDLADFAQVLRNHTLMEEQQLFPLLEKLFTPEQWQVVLDFEPLGSKPSPVGTTQPAMAARNADEWLAAVDAHFQATGKGNGHIVLFPRYQPELVEKLANHLGLVFFDYQKTVMTQWREQAELIPLAQLEQTLREQSRAHGLVCHNVEALLAVKPPEERQAWLQHFLSAAWAHPVVLPITVFQAEVPEDSPQVCDLELAHLPRQTASRAEPGQRLPYDVL